MNENFIEKLKIFIEDINKKHPIKFAYLFGSHAKGTDNKMSDIDIAIEFLNKYSDMEDALVRGEIMDKAQGIFKGPVDVVSLYRSSIFLKHEVVKNGILLKDDVERADFESLVFREYFDFKYYSDIYDEAMMKRIKDKTYMTKRNKD